MHKHLPRTDEQIIRMVTTLSADGDVEIPHLIKRLEELCDPEHEPVSGFWLRHVTEDSHEDWCWDCGIALRNYFNCEGDKPETVWDGEEIPDWTPAEYSTDIDGGWAIESDSARCCYRCGRMLLFCPTDEFIQRELDHYESTKPDEDWWSFRIFLEAALAYSKEPAWYARVVLLAHKWIPMEELDG
jgi:hypothetical protein